MYTGHYNILSMYVCMYNYFVNYNYRQKFKNDLTKNSAGGVLFLT